MTEREISRPELKREKEKGKMTFLRDSMVPSLKCLVRLGWGTLMSFKPSKPSSSFSFSCFLPLGIMDDWALSLNKSLKIHKDLTFIFSVPQCSQQAK
jgi:hypothetical protein